MTARKPKALLVAKDSFVCEVKGEQHIVREGDTVAANHPAVAGREELFAEHVAKPTVDAA